MLRLLVLFTLLPALELIVLIEIGSRIGTLPTVGLIILTGVVGATLARYQGLAVLLRMRREVAEGHLPAAALLDGVIILIAAALLVTPGVITDAVGFLLLIPLTRTGIRRLLRRWLEGMIQSGRANVVIHMGPSGPDDDPV